MKQENKELLLKDLCARLPYDVKVCIKLPNHQKKVFEEHIGDLKELTRDGGYLVNSKGIDYRSFNLDIKPYLRSMSSMTEEEAMEYANCGNIIANSPQNNYLIPNPNCVDWLNSHHFDYRGLIEKGLAIAVTK